MATVYERIEPRLARWIGEQPVFFVATAPPAADGRNETSLDGLPGLAGLPGW